MTTTDTAASIRGLVASELDAVTAIRRDLHAHPELGFDESRTSGVVQRELAALGIAHRSGIGGERPGTGTGVVAHIPATVADAGPGAGTCIGLRADMDALPIHEETGRDYASTTPGVMHACGHDGHTANLLGVARVLMRMEHRPNPVTLVFQPAEEGGGGGEKMCRDGALDGGVHEGIDLGPPVARMYGLHGWPEMPLGQVGTRAGPLLAATDEFDVTIEGVGGHAAFPHKTADPVLCSAHVITALQSIVSRNTGPTDSCVVTVATTQNPSVAHNVIPPHVNIGGTVRTLTAETRSMARERFYAVVEGTCAAMGCRAEITWHDGYPVTRNDADEVARVMDVARSLVGESDAIDIPEPFMGGEDFSYYCERVPSCFFVLGLTPPGLDPNTVPKLHQAGFDFNDDALAIGMEMMARLATGAD